VFDQSTPCNPYDSAIEEVGIGAFPLLPTPGHDRWLREHLRTALGLDMTDPEEHLDPATLLAKENVRIPVTGLEYHDEDLLLVPLSDRQGFARSPDYYKRFRDGTATGYHTRVDGGPSLKRLRKVRYLAAVVPVPGQPGLRRIHGLFRIVPTIEEHPRYELSAALTGIEPDPTDTTPFHVLRFEPEWIPLLRPMDVAGRLRGNWFRYTRHDLLQRARDLVELKIVRERPTAL
jgi:hypothetical protein